MTDNIRYLDAQERAAYEDKTGRKLVKGVRALASHFGVTHPFFIRRIHLGEIPFYMDPCVANAYWFDREEVKEALKKKAAERTARFN